MAPTNFNCSKHKKHLLLVLLLLAVLFLRLPLAAQAAPAAQVTYATPTPGADGRIIYTVQEGDSCLRISLLTGVSVEYIRQTNHLDENCTILSGQRLVIGIGAPPPPSPTAGPSPTPTTALPTPTPVSGGLAEVCVALYNDSNGDGLRQANTDALGDYVADGTEPIVPGGAISLTSLTGTYSQTQSTVAGLDPVCFMDVPDGEYSVSAAVPDGYNPTTVLNYSLQILPGDTSFVSFGAQAKSQLPVESEKPKRSPLLGILGALLLLTGIGLGVFAFRTRK
jgi:hypothetical protein